MREPPSHEPNSQQSQPEPNVQQKNAGSMGGGQQAAIGDRNVQVQGKGNWVWNFFFGWGGKSLTPRQEYRNRQALLNKVNNIWVKGVLEKSLYNQVMIELGLEERPDAITNPWSAIIETDDSPQPLPDGTKIIDIFDQIGIGRTLLILGEPGSGKTTTLLELTRDLIARAGQDINLLIPVVFNLSSWANKREKIADWLVEELNSKYDVPKKIGQAWVTQQQLLPLLDGLDEVKADYRDDCIAALNKLKQDYGAELVVCSRIKDYEALSNRLNFQSAVYIRLLTLEQICDYLDTVGADLAGLRALMAKDTVLQKLAQSPLMLNIMTLAYQGVELEDLPKNEVLEERRRQLFDDYIKKMFNRPNRSKGDPQYLSCEQKARQWLIWMANKMIQASQSIFFIEQIQQKFLENSIQKHRYQSFIKNFDNLISILAGCIIFPLMFWAGDSAITIWINICLGLMVFLSFSFEKFKKEKADKNIQTIDKINWSWKKAFYNLFKQDTLMQFSALITLILLIKLFLAEWFSFAIISLLKTADYILNSTHFSRYNTPNSTNIISGLVAGYCVSLIFNFINNGISNIEINTTDFPNQRIWNSLKNTILFTCILFFVSGSIFLLLWEQ